MNRARRIAIAVAVGAVATLGLVTALVPSTSSAYIAKVTNSTNTAASAGNFTCAGAIANDSANAIYQFPLTETAVSELLGAANSANAATPGTYRGTFATSATTPIACPRDTGGAYVLDGTSSYISTPTQLSSPQVFSTEVWFKTSVAGGRLIGFGASQTGTSSQYDRQTYLTTTGQLVFGTYNSGYDTIISPAGTSYADGNWHQVVSTMSSAGMFLYVDGKQVASNSAYTVAETDNGYWRIGYDNLSGWTGTASNYYFKGSMRFAGVYKTALTAAQVLNHYAAGQ
jgi:hypothetical protein